MKAIKVTQTGKTITVELSSIADADKLCATMITALLDSRTAPEPPKPAKVAGKR